MLDETGVLVTLQRYYLDDITFEKVASDAGITLYELIEYVRKNELPIVLTDEDRVEGIRKVSELMEKHGMKSALRIAEESYQKVKAGESP